MGRKWLENSEEATKGNGLSLNGFTRTQRILLGILADGMPHSREELRVAIDGLATFNNLQKHLTEIRRRIRPQSEDIICEYSRRRLCYRHVRLLHSAYDGRR